MSERGQKLINEVRMVAAKNPDFTYEEPTGAASCVYVHEGRPSCLIGHALWNLGHIDSSIEGKRFGGNYVNGEDVRVVLSWLNLEIDQSEKDWLERVQVRQDNGEPWGHCVGIS